MSPDITPNISLKGITHTEFCHPNVVPERYDFFLLKEMFCRLFFVLISMQQQRMGTEAFKLQKVCISLMSSSEAIQQVYM